MSDTATPDTAHRQDAPDPREFELRLEPDYCCGGGHCGPLPGYTFVCPSCHMPSGCRTGEHLRPGELLTCYLCQRQLRLVRELSDFHLVFNYAN